MVATILLAALASTTQPNVANSADNAGLDAELSPPVRIEAAGKPIDTETGHAAPFVADFDGDGVPDLLVGQFGNGQLLIFHNDGSAAAPRFAKAQLFKDGADTGRVPSG